MGKKTCIECGIDKKFLSRNLAGIQLDNMKKSIRFPARIKPNVIPGDRKKDYLCKECASKIIFTCKEHGEIDSNIWQKNNLPICKMCNKEYRKFGPPPSGYDSIEAFECPGSAGSFGGDLVKVREILNTHRCSCGGTWDLIVGNSPMPSGIADNGYTCEKCGYKKWFRFRLWKTEAPFPY